MRTVVFTAIFPVLGILDAGFFRDRREDTSNCGFKRGGRTQTKDRTRVGVWSREERADTDETDRWAGTSQRFQVGPEQTSAGQRRPVSLTDSFAPALQPNAG